MSLEQERKEYL